MPVFFAVNDFMIYSLLFIFYCY